MSFNNNEDGDGLAALFGGITPQAAPKPAEQEQAAAQAAAQLAAQSAAQSVAQSTGQPSGQPTQAPASFPGGPPVQTPGYAAPTSYDLPAPTSYDLPAPADATLYSGSAPVPAATPQYPGLAPNGASATQPPPTQLPPIQLPPAAQFPGTQLPGTQLPGTQLPPAYYPTEQYPPAQVPPTQFPAANQQPHASPYPGLQPPTAYEATSEAPLWAQPNAQQSQAPQAPVQPNGAYPPQANPDSPAPFTEPPGFPSFQQPPQGASTTLPGEYAQPHSYNLPAPAQTPSDAAHSTFTTAPGHQPDPGYQPSPGYQPAPEHGQGSGYPQATGFPQGSGYPQAPAYEPTSAFPQAPAYEPTSAFPQAPIYDPPPAAHQPVPSSEPQPTTLPAQGHFGAYEPMSAAASSAPSGPAVGAALAATPVSPAGPLLPSRTAAVVTPEDIERPTAGERIGLVLALLLGPVGLLIAIVFAARGGRRRGWLIGISRVSLVLGVLSTIAAVIVGVIGWNIRVDQMQRDDLAAASAEFCAAAEADPTMVAPPTLGFPTQQNSIPETIDALTAWTTRWTDLAATSPPELKAGLELLAAKGQTIVDSVTESRLIEDALNAQVIGSSVTQSGVPAWYANYCVAP